MKNLHIYFFPLMAPSHMIPLVDMARQLARHDPNLKATIVLPHFCVPQFRATIERDREQGSDISIRQVSFPNARAGVLDESASLDPPRVSSAQLLKEEPPADCVVSDFFISWTADLASELRVPRIVVHLTGFFPLCVHHSLIKHKPFVVPGPDLDAPFVVPGLPHVVKTTKRQLPHFLLDDDKSPGNRIMENAKKAASASYGVVFNSFKELEPDYVEYYKTNIGSKAWHVGPVSFCNTNTIDKAQRGGGGDGEEEHCYCLDWLRAKEPNSVVYVCFGTMSSFPVAQVHEIATGLESCGRDFVWVVKDLELLPDGFEERIGDRGVIVKSWAPQVLILEQESVGGFLTHCGWNSLLEGVTAGKPMITWPISSEQFENEKLVTEILKIGVGVGCVEWSERLDVKKCLVKGESVAKAVNRVMGGGEESVEMKNRVMELSDKAKKAVEAGGSSCNDMDSLLAELRSVKDITAV